MLATALGYKAVEGRLPRLLHHRRRPRRPHHQAALEGRWETTMRFWNGPQVLIIDLCRYRDYADIVVAAGLNAVRCLGFSAMAPAGLSA